MDELYVIARSVLLDAIEATAAYREATILVGAQAVYLQTGNTELGLAPYTTDADLALDPQRMPEIPPLEVALKAAGFHGSTGSIGTWKTQRRTPSELQVEVQVDLLVPASLSPGTGRRAARLVGHAADVARKVEGLEGVMVDCSEREIAALDPTDARVIRMRVAGPAALLVAKMFKIRDRLGSARGNDKDALDVLRLLQATSTAALADRMRDILDDPRSASAGAEALNLFNGLFGDRGAPGSMMAARAGRPLLDEDEIRLACAALAEDLLSALGQRVPRRR